MTIVRPAERLLNLASPSPIATVGFRSCERASSSPWQYQLAYTTPARRGSISKRWNAWSEGLLCVSTCLVPTPRRYGAHAEAWASCATCLR